MKIGIVLAMEKEFAQVESLLHDKTETLQAGFRYVRGRAGQNELTLLQCGIGKVNAAIGATRLIEYARPEAIVSTGVAGGASLQLEVQDVVVSTETAYHDLYVGPYSDYGQVPGLPKRFASDAVLVERAAALDCGVRIRPGLIVTGDWFVDTKEKMREILRRNPDALAVDMESAAIAHTCFLYGIPFVSFRIISDIPLLPGQARQYADFWEHVAGRSFRVTASFLRAL